MSVAELIDLLHTFNKDWEVVVETWDNRTVTSALCGKDCVILYHDEVTSLCKMCGVNESSEDSAYCDNC